MNWVWPWLLIGWSSIALGQTTPIRGATGGGYGQFSWGTSLETVERLTPRMRLNNGTATAQEVRQLLAQLAKSSRSKATRPILNSYRYWIQIGPLPARVDLEFLRGRLASAIVTMTYSGAQSKVIHQALSVLSAKYGEPLTDRSERADPSVDEAFQFNRPAGPISVQHLRPNEVDRGILTIQYSSKEFGPSIHTYVDKLRAKVADTAAEAAGRRRENNQKSPTKLQRQLHNHL